MRNVHALRDVSFEIGEGERVGIIGRNGAGETTLLSLLAGITDPSSGDVRIVGDVHAMLTIGAVLRDEATGRENIYLDGVVHGKSRENIDAHVDEVIAFSELAEFIDRPVRTVFFRHESAACLFDGNLHRTRHPDHRRNALGWRRVFCCQGQSEDEGNHGQGTHRDRGEPRS